jgi:hypothetical protein
MYVPYSRHFTDESQWVMLFTSTSNPHSLALVKIGMTLTQSHGEVKVTFGLP